MNSVLVGMPTWYDQARCVAVGADPELFFPTCNGPVPQDHESRQICAACPVASECLVYAKDNDLKGIWGGLTEDERNGVRRRSPGYCLHGHKLTPQNTYTRPADGRHECLICRRERSRRSPVNTTPRDLPPLTSPTCKHGHEWTPENTLVVGVRQRRKCRACHRAAAKRYYERKRAA